jgi:MED7 protein
MDSSALRASIQAGPVVPPAAGQLPQALPLRPPEFYKLFDEFPELTTLPPPPLPDGALKQYSVFGEEHSGRKGDGQQFVPPLSQFDVEQLYDERAFQPNTATSSSSAAGSSSERITPKSELKRLSLELRAHVQLVARALAEEALGLGVTEEENPSSIAARDDFQSAPAATPTASGGIRLPAKEPKSFLLAKRCELIQLNMAHLLARTREMEAWHRLEMAARAGEWTEKVVLGTAGGAGAAQNGTISEQRRDEIMRRAKERISSLMVEAAAKGTKAQQNEQSTAKR